MSGETFPKLINCLRKTKLIPDKFVTSGNHWDPCYSNRNVRKVYREIGLNIRQRIEDFWSVWKTVLSPSTFIITIPPFGKSAIDWLVAFLEFLVTFDRPFFSNFTKPYLYKNVLSQCCCKDSFSKRHFGGLLKAFQCKKLMKINPGTFMVLQFFLTTPNHGFLRLIKLSFTLS